MRIFLTHVASRAFSMKEGISLAATHFSHNLISGGGFDASYSILPAFVCTKPQDSESCLQVEYSLLRRTPLRKLAPLVEQWNLFRKIPRKSSVWLYNYTLLNAFLVKFLRWFKPSVKVFTIVLDFTPGDPGSDRWLPAINKCDGRILLSTSELFAKSNSFCLPGVVPVGDVNFPTIGKLVPEFLISGALGENISLLSRLLSAFAKLPDAKLHVCGIAPDFIHEYCSKFPNILYHGKVSYEQFNQLLNSVPFLLSTRDPKMPENQCNFPSKIIEGLLHNRIIISTIDYPQLGSIKYLKVDADDLVGEIRRILMLPDSEILSYANQSEQTYQSFNTDVWNQVMSRLEHSVL